MADGKMERGPGLAPSPRDRRSTRFAVAFYAPQGWKSRIGAAGGALKAGKGTAREEVRANVGKGCGRQGNDAADLHPPAAETRPALVRTRPAGNATPTR